MPARSPARAAPPCCAGFGLAAEPALTIGDRDAGIGIVLLSGHMIDPAVSRDVAFDPASPRGLRRCRRWCSRLAAILGWTRHLRRPNPSSCHHGLLFLVNVIGRVPAKRLCQTGHHDCRPHVAAINPTHRNRASISIRFARRTRRLLAGKGRIYRAGDPAAAIDLAAVCHARLTDFRGIDAEETHGFRSDADRVAVDHVNSAVGSCGHSLGKNGENAADYQSNLHEKQVDAGILAFKDIR